MQKKLSFSEQIIYDTANTIFLKWSPEIMQAAKKGECSVYIYRGEKITSTVENCIKEEFGLNLKRIEEVCRGSCDFGCTCNSKVGYIVSW
jgi:hypothetical protein